MCLCIAFCKNCVYTKAHLAPKKRDNLGASQKANLQSVTKNKINYTLGLGKIKCRKENFACVYFYLYKYI